MLTILTRHVSSKQRGAVADGNLSALQSNSFKCKKGLTPEVQPRSADWQTNAFSHLCFSYSLTLTFLQCFKKCSKTVQKVASCAFMCRAARWCSGQPHHLTAWVLLYGYPSFLPQPKTMHEALQQTGELSRVYPASYPMTAPPQDPELDALSGS